VPASGSITFTASPTRIVDAAASPPVTIFPAAIVCTLDASGVLIGPMGATGVNLIATDDPDLNPTDWTYNVAFDLDGVDAFDFDMALPVGDTVDLSTVVPVEASSGIASILIPVAILVALSDETTPLTAATNKVTMRAPYAFTLTEVRASLATVSSSGLVTADINVNGTTILSTKLSIDANEDTSETAATPAVISDGDIEDDDELTFDCDAAGTGATGHKVLLLGYRPVVIP
jgi:hypothetical protein